MAGQDRNRAASMVSVPATDCASWNISANMRVWDGMFSADTGFALRCESNCPADDSRFGEQGIKVDMFVIYTDSEHGLIRNRIRFRRKHREKMWDCCCWWFPSG